MRMDAVAAPVSVAWAVSLLHGVMSLGAGMLTLDAADAAAAAEVAVVADGLRTIGGPCAELVCPSGRLFSQRSTAQLAPMVRFPRGIGIPILLVLRCLCFPAMPAGMPPVLSWLLVLRGSNRIVARPTGLL